MSRLLSTKNSLNLLNKFKGTLLGVLVGDCCGSPYENEILSKGDKTGLHKCLVQLEGPMFKAPRKPFTDDTAMTIAVAKCLIDNKSLVAKELATLMVQLYFENPRRGYSKNMEVIFHKLRQTKLEDPLIAENAFGGRGSFGNGAAMRVSPVALFCHNKDSQLYKLVTQSSIITHTHRIGINGAILLALGINYCLKLHPSEFEVDVFIDFLLREMKSVENEEEYLKLEQQPEYQHQIQEIRALLYKELPPSDEEILNKLGHSAAAQYSVPTAIFSFLKIQKSKDSSNETTVFRDTIEFAISLGGDTDTIASMAGSLVGALYGNEVISENLLKHCEFSEAMEKIAEELYNISQ